MASISGSVLLALLVFCCGAVAQNLAYNSADPVSRVEPVWPETTLSGTVRVAVKVAESGNVVSVENVYGPGDICSGVTRPDVVAIKEAARDAALKAIFAPLERAGVAVANQAWVLFELPETANAPEASAPAAGSGEMYSVAEAAPPTQTEGTDKTKYRVKGDIFKADRANTAENAPPPDYQGPVNTGGTSSPPPGDNSLPALPKTISGGVLNGKAMSLPKPPYPPAARAVRASGAVSIQVLITEDGQVFSAKAVSGHPLLRAASQLAACGSQFPPTTLSGVPVKVSGVITYNFVP